MIPDAFEKVIGWEFRIRCGKSVLRIITFFFCDQHERIITTLAVRFILLGITGRDVHA